MTNSEESEGSLSFSTTTSIYELDFVQDEYTSRSSWASLPIRILKAVLTYTKAVTISGLITSWELLTFLFFYVLFIQRRMVAFVYFLEETKDTLVRILMWRRGLLFRPTTHGGLLVLGSIALIVGSLFARGVTPQDFSRDQVLAATNTPETTIPEGRPRSEMVKYTIQKGDTLSKVASIYKINVNTIKWANGITSVDEIKPGDVLSIPPVTGIVHKVKKGDNLRSVAKKYKVNAQNIADYPFNYIDDSFVLRIGQTVYVPGGKMPAPTPLPQITPPSSQPVFYAVSGSGLFSWPVKGTLNQSASWYHPAIDIGAAYGAPVVAAAGGTVITAGWSSYGFGNYIVVKHNNGYTTHYAHLGSISVGAGQAVGKGQLVGGVGCTGFCTGSHLHFEIHRDGRSINPLSVL
jgi:murein DD-endopeptidase MepM/ murein hydrolase activator NlpD